MTTVLFRLLSVLTVAATGAVFLIVSSQLIGIAIDGADQIVAVAMFVIGVGLVAMILHMNMVWRPSSDERQTWVTALWFAAPLVAAAYLWQVPARVRRRD